MDAIAMRIGLWGTILGLLLWAGGETAPLYGDSSGEITLSFLSEPPAAQAPSPHNHSPEDAAYGHAYQENEFGHSSAQSHHHPADADVDWIGPFRSHRHEEGEHDGEDEHGHARHGSLEGYPFVHPIRTKVDLIERALETELAITRGAERGRVDELVFETELIWAINDRMAFTLATPLIARDTRGESFFTGIGDLEVGYRFLCYQGRRSMVFLGLDVWAPTGDSRLELGDGHASLVPKALWLYDFGGGWYTENVLGWEVPVNTRETAAHFSYDLALCRTCLLTREWRFFRYLTWIGETNGRTSLQGEQPGETCLDLTFGARWQVLREDEVGVGWSFPITGHREFSHQVLLSYLKHF